MARGPQILGFKSLEFDSVYLGKKKKGKNSSKWGGWFCLPFLLINEHEKGDVNPDCS